MNKKMPLFKKVAFFIKEEEVNGLTS